MAHQSGMTAPGQVAIGVSGGDGGARPDIAAQDHHIDAGLDGLLHVVGDFDRQRPVGIVAEDEIAVFVEDVAAALVEIHLEPGAVVGGEGEGAAVSGQFGADIVKQLFVGGGDFDASGLVNGRLVVIDAGGKLAFQRVELAFVGVDRQASGGIVVDVIGHQVAEIEEVIGDDAVAHEVGEIAALDAKHVRELLTGGDGVEGIGGCSRIDRRLKVDLDFGVQGLEIGQARLEIVDVKLVMGPGGQRDFVLGLGGKAESHERQAKNH